MSFDFVLDKYSINYAKDERISKVNVREQSLQSMSIFLSYIIRASFSVLNCPLFNTTISWKEWDGLESNILFSKFWINRQFYKEIKFEMLSE